MPNCEACAHHWTPTSMRPDGTCPSCGRPLELTKPLRPVGAAHPVDPVDAVDPSAPGGPGAPGAPGPSGDDEEVIPKAPWHFKVLLVGLALYLAWRGVQGVEWLASRL